MTDGPYTTFEGAPAPRSRRPRRLVVTMDFTYRDRGWAKGRDAAWDEIQEKILSVCEDASIDVHRITTERIDL